MREILFRGKSKGKPEWVHGYLYQEGSESFIITSGRHYPGINKEHAILGFLDWFEVFPETVGQYTGLKDKNGKMIFEGDVVLVEKFRKGVIRYLEKEALFAVDFSSHLLRLCDTTSDYIEIIGNIHEEEKK